jgi:hypothetical protein
MSIPANARSRERRKSRERKKRSKAVRRRELASKPLRNLPNHLVISLGIQDGRWFAQEKGGEL